LETYAADLNRTYAELRRHLHHMTVLHAVNLRIASALDPDEVLAGILDSLGQMLAYRTAAVYLMDLDVVVPGHGALTDKSGIREFRDYLVYVRDESKKCYDKGMDYIQAAEAISLKPWAPYTEVMLFGSLCLLGAVRLAWPRSSSRVRPLARPHDGRVSFGCGLAGGLALVEPEPGLLIAFNAAPGTVAPEGQGPYGPYAQALAEMIREGGLPLADVFLAVLRRARSRSGLFDGDRRHFYDILLRRGWTVRRVLEVSMAITFVLVIAGWSCAHGIVGTPFAIGIIVSGVVLAAYVLGSLQPESKPVQDAHRRTSWGSALD